MWHMHEAQLLTSLPFTLHSLRQAASLSLSLLLPLLSWPPLPLPPPPPPHYLPGPRRRDSSVKTPPVKGLPPIKLDTLIVLRHKMSQESACTSNSTSRLGCFDLTVCENTDIERLDL